MKRWCVLLGLAACEPTIAVTPASPETRSVLIVALDEGTVAAAAVGEKGASYFGSSPIEVLSFGCSVERLGMVPGPQPLQLDAAEEWLLPDGLGVRRSVDPQLGEWKDLPEAGPEASTLLRRLPLSRDNRCIASRAILEPRVLALDGLQGEPAFALAVDGKSALVGTHGGVYLIDRDGAFERIDLGDQQLLAGFGRDGEFWYFAASGALLRGPLRGPLEVVTSTTPVPPEAEWAVLTGSPSGAPFELYLATGPSSENRRGFARFDGVAWSAIAAVAHLGRFRAGVAWIAPGEAVAIGLDTNIINAVVRYRQGVVTSEILPGDLVGAASIAHFPALGTYVGRDNGELDHYEGGTWSDTNLGRGGYFTRTIAPIGDGFIYGTGTMFNFLGYRFAQYFPDLGACPLETLTEFAAFQLIPLEDGSLIASTVGTFDGPTTPVVLTMVAQPKDCGPAGQNSD